MKRMVRSAVFGLTLGSALLSQFAQSQQVTSIPSEPTGREWYGQAMYQFFSNDYETAAGLYEKALDAGFNDPRPLYFLGLTKLYLGDEPTALDHWSAAARLEALDPSLALTVNRALDRVQGDVRLQLEEHRKQVKKEALAQAAAEIETRYSRIKSNAESFAAPPKPGRLAPDANPFSDEPGQLKAPSAPPKAEPEAQPEPEAKPEAKPEPEPKAEQDI